MNADSQDEFSYDRLPYGSRVFPLTSPDRLATVARLHCLDPQAPEDCRVLELGCGDGTNLLSMAYALPASRFVGIDLSTVHVEQAKKAAERLELTNVEFMQADVSTIDPGHLGRFDFISAHGLFSWVPELVRDAVLKLYSSCLSDNGIGYISYNAYPGSRLREMMWEAMKFHASSETNEKDRVRRGREIIQFIAAAAPAGSYKSLVTEEAARLAERDDANVFHDDFSESNRPYYFHEFAELLSSNGLSYVGEAEVDVRLASEIPPRAIEIIEQFSRGDRIRQEQYFDLATGRRFRSSIICRSSSNVSSHPVPEALLKLRLSSQLGCEAGVDIDSLTPIVFSTPDGNTVEIANPATKRALQRLSTAYPHTVPGAYMASADDVSTLAELIRLYEFGLISVCSYQPPFVSDVSKRPRASRFARWQIDAGARGVTTLAGPNVEISQPIVRRLLFLLDGSRTRSELVDDLLTGIPVEQRSEEVREQLEETVDGNLRIFAELGLMEG